MTLRAKFRIVLIRKKNKGRIYAYRTTKKLLSLIERGLSGEARKLLEENPSLNPDFEYLGTTTLHQASINAATDLVKLFISKYGISPDTQNAHGMTPFDCIDDAICHDGLSEEQYEPVLSLLGSGSTLY